MNDRVVKRRVNDGVVVLLSGGWLIELLFCSVGGERSSCEKACESQKPCPLFTSGRGTAHVIIIHSHNIHNVDIWLCISKAIYSHIYIYVYIYRLEI